jgi:hypothetical protein
MAGSQRCKTSLSKQQLDDELCMITTVNQIFDAMVLFTVLLSCWNSQTRV